MRCFSFVGSGNFPRLIFSPLATTFFLVAAVVHLLGGAAVAGSEEAGVWTGTVDQPGSGTYGMVMELDGRGGGSTNYPSLSCSGSLSGGESKYFETIVTNRAVEGGDDGCIDGNISIFVSGDTLHWRWSGSWLGESYTASATLKRQGDGDAQKCNLCGQTRAEGVGFGLSSSPSRLPRCNHFDDGGSGACVNESVRGANRNR